MDRRRFLLSSAAGALVAPLTGEAQQAAMPAIGVLHGVSETQWTDRMVGFHRGLAEAGFAEGRNVGIEYRWAEGHFGCPQWPRTSLAEGSVLSVRAPPRDGGNEDYPDRVPIRCARDSCEIAPNLTRVALLVNPNNPGLMQDNIEQFSPALRRLGLEIFVVKAGSESGIERAFATAVQERAKAMHIGADAYLSSRSLQVSSLALRYALLTSSESREGAAAGLLMSYGQSHAAVFRQLGLYVGRILKGAKPAELPVLQPTNFELVINLKTAKALGLTIPQSLLIRADQVIE